MRSRKIYFIISISLLLLLFFIGTVVLSSINIFFKLPAADSKPSNSNSSTNNIVESLNLNSNPFNMLLLIGDKSEANTDTIMILNYNPSTNKLNVLSIPRDTRVELDGITFPKVNSYYSRKNGLQLLIHALNEVMGIKINYYSYVNINTVKEIVDLLGGVDYYVPADMYYLDPTQNLYINLKKGFQHMDGNKVEQLLRFRKPSSGHNNADLKKIYDGSDLNRIQIQQNFLKELIKQKSTIYYLPRMGQIIDIIYNNIETNITLNEVLGFLKNISSFNLNKVQMYMVPGSADTIDGTSYYVFDKESLGKIIADNFQTDGNILDYPDVHKQIASVTQ